MNCSPNILVGVSEFLYMFVEKASISNSSCQVCKRQFGGFSLLPSSFCLFFGSFSLLFFLSLFFYLVFLLLNFATFPLKLLFRQLKGSSLHCLQYRHIRSRLLKFFSDFSYNL